MKEWFLHSWGLIPELCRAFMKVIRFPPWCSVLLLSFLLTELPQSVPVPHICIRTPGRAPLPAPSSCWCSLGGSLEHQGQQLLLLQWGAHQHFSFLFTSRLSERQLYFTAISLQSLCYRTGKEIHVFEPNPIDARSPFKLQQEQNFSTKSVDPFLAESHFKENWPDKILFYCKRQHFWIDAEFPLTSW